MSYARLFGHAINGCVTCSNMQLAVWSGPILLEKTSSKERAEVNNVVLRLGGLAEVFEKGNGVDGNSMGVDVESSRPDEAHLQHPNVGLYQSRVYVTIRSSPGSSPAQVKRHGRRKAAKARLWRRRADERGTGTEENKLASDPRWRNAGMFGHLINHVHFLE